MDKNIPISELIRIGSKITQKTKGVCRDKEGRTCALGAAYTAKFGELPPTNMRTTEVCRKLGLFEIDLEKTELPMPMRIPDVADDWPRERIADWLESIGR